MNSKAREKRTYRKTGLYIAKIDEHALDGRTITAKLIHELKAALEDYVGGEPTIAAQLLIQRIVYKHLRLTAYENAFIENPEHVEAAHFIPLSNSLRRDLESLAEMTQEKKPLDLKTYIAEKYSSEKRTAG